MSLLDNLMPLVTKIPKLNSTQIFSNYFSFGTPDFEGFIFSPTCTISSILPKDAGPFQKD